MSSLGDVLNRLAERVVRQLKAGNLSDQLESWEKKNKHTWFSFKPNFIMSDTLDETSYMW
jgi:hypothetical protein